METKYYGYELYLKTTERRLSPTPPHQCAYISSQRLYLGGFANQVAQH